MQRTRTLLIVISILGIFLATAYAQRGRGVGWQGSGQWGPGTLYGRLYNPATVETVSGEVVSVEVIMLQRGMAGGVHLLLKTDKETVSVHLGPAWYIQRQDVGINLNDKLEIKGSRIMFQGKPAIIAAEVYKGTVVLKLRDENGFPAWSGWRRR